MSSARARRLLLAGLLLVSLAGTALAFQGTAAPAVLRPLRFARLHALPARDAAGLTRLDSGLRALVRPTLQKGRVSVEIDAVRPTAATDAVHRLGGIVGASYRNLVDARVPVAALGALSRDASVSFVQRPAHSYEDAIPGEEVQASLAAASQANGVTGKGVKVAIIDGSFAGLAARQASGDLPTNVVTRDFCEGDFLNGEGHGTAVAEIVHEMAPDAQLYLLCEGGLADLAQAEQFAKKQGVKIVNYSAEWFNQGRGTNDAGDEVDQVVADANAGGMLWVNSAGNDADTHWSGTFTDTNGDGYTDFTSGDEGNSFIAPGGDVFCGFLKWDEWPAATSDFDLVLLDSDGTVVAASNNVQNGTQPPIEEKCVQNPYSTNHQFAWAIYGQNLKSNPRFDLYSENTSSLQYQSAAYSIGDPASSPSAFAVGALCWQDNQLEFYSSQGPTADGRVKPDIAGHDSVSGATFGPFDGSCPSGFAGTSASSPEVAGAAALVKSANPSFTAAQIRAFLQQNASDLGPAGVDNQFGAGALRLPTLVVKLDKTPPVVRALASKGVRGHAVKLTARLFDDSGEVKVRDQVKRNGVVIKTLTSSFLSTLKPSTTVLTWTAPKGLKGTITHCVRGQDRAGNLSAVSCAKVTLSG
jgi:subtilisin family serine protease